MGRRRGSGDEDEHWAAWDQWGDEHPKEGGRKKARTRLKGKGKGRVEPWIEPPIEGLVVAIGSKHCLVRHRAEGPEPSVEADPDGFEETECVLAGELAKSQRSQFAVGDQVKFWRREQGPPAVREVLPRSSELCRPDPLNPRVRRLLVANVDRVVHVISLAEPSFRAGLVDRIWIAAKKGGAGHLLFVNKFDLAPTLEPEELSRIERYLEAHQDHGMEVLRGTAALGDGVPELSKAIAHQRVVFVGHSGVGKSSLLNALSPDLDLLTQDVKASSGTGRHTTTRSEVYFLGEGTEVIDTPGVRQFGLWGLSSRELTEVFPEFQTLEVACQFADCSHVHEPGCGVLRALETEELSKDRYEVYLELRESLVEEGGEA